MDSPPVSKVDVEKSPAKKSMQFPNSLRAQILFSHLLLVLLMLFTMAGAVAGFFHLGRSIDTILVDNYKSVIAAETMKETLERQDSAATFLLAGQPEKARAQYQANWPEFARALAVEAHNITEPGEQQMADDLTAGFDSYRKAVERLLYATPPMRAEEARTYYFSTLEPAFLRLKQRAQDVLDVNQAAIVRADEVAKAEARRLSLTGIGVTVLVGIAAILASMRMTRAALSPLRDLSQQAEDIGRGNLGQRIALDRSDELGILAQSFNQMSQRLLEARRIETLRLHRAERTSEAALESLYDPVVVTDADGAIVYFNRAAEALFGPADEYLGHTLASTPWGSGVAEAVRLAIDGQKGAETSDRMMPLGMGEMQRIFRLRASPMRDEDDTLLGAVAVLEDITNLRELDRLKTEFIGVASHELRTPVTSLVLSVDLLLEEAVGPLTPAQKELVEAQREDLSRLQNLMAELLDTTRLEAGAEPPCVEPVAVRRLIDPAVQALAQDVEQAHLQMNVSVPADLPSALADAPQVTRVLVNLLSNAVRHTPVDGHVDISVSALDDQVVFTVRDSGVGIPPAYLPRIFERFVQVPGATRGGAGLGLSIARQIVLAHQGRIWVESQPGKGSTFFFSLPAAAPASRS